MLRLGIQGWFVRTFPPGGGDAVYWFCLRIPQSLLWEWLVSKVEKGKGSHVWSTSTTRAIASRFSITICSSHTHTHTHTHTHSLSLSLSLSRGTRRRLRVVTSKRERFAEQWHRLCPWHRLKDSRKRISWTVYPKTIILCNIKLHVGFHSLDKVSHEILYFVMYTILINCRCWRIDVKCELCWQEMVSLTFYLATADRRLMR